MRKCIFCILITVLVNVGTFTLAVLIGIDVLKPMMTTWSSSSEALTVACLYTVVTEALLMMFLIFTDGWLLLGNGFDKLWYEYLNLFYGVDVKKLLCLVSLLIGLLIVAIFISTQLRYIATKL